MDDDDYEDLLGEDDQDVPIPEEESMQDTSSAAIIPEMPSANEIRLGQKVADLEAEQAQLLAEIETLKSREVLSPTIPVPAEPPAARPIVIPHDLLPTLQLLRTHIGELTKDNEALRYTFIGRTQEASSSKVKLDDPPDIAMEPIPGGVQGVDLAKVVERVKELIRENEELGEMVLEAGRGGAEEYEKTLSDSRKIIESLESDLEHHAKTVQSLRTELVSYRTHFGPIPASKDNRSGSGASNQPRPDSTRDRDRDRDRDREGDRRHPEPSRGGNAPSELSIRGMSNQNRPNPGSASGGGGERRDDRRQDSSRQDRGPAPGSRSDERRDDRPSGGRRRDDDRGSKRRR